MPTFASFIQHSIRSPSQSNWRGKEIKDSLIGCFTLFAVEMILYMENPKDSTHTHTKKNLLELIQEVSKVARCKGNILMLHLYTNSKLSEREIKKTVQFIIASKRINS